MWGEMTEDMREEVYERERGEGNRYTALGRVLDEKLALRPVDGSGYSESMTDPNVVCLASLVGETPPLLDELGQNVDEVGVCIIS